jgi:hypothetical protein
VTPADLLAAEAAYQATVGSLLFAAGAVTAAVYEAFAIKTDRLPTITEVVKAGGWPARIAFVGVVTLALADHFIFEVLL